MTQDEEIRAAAFARFQRDSRKAFQRHIADVAAGCLPRTAPTSLASARVAPIPLARALRIIERYEWLGTTGRCEAAYGLILGKTLLGVACFGKPPGTESLNVCGPDLRDRTICLERGACVHWAPKNAASFLISRAVRLARADHGWEIFVAYADEQAGEIGTVYQASNWAYLGCGVGRGHSGARETYRKPDGKIVSSRTMRAACGSKSAALASGWTVAGLSLNKHKYVWFEGTRSRRRQLRAACRFSFKPYPKRSRSESSDNQSERNRLHRDRS